MRRQGIEYASAVEHVSNLTKASVDDYAARAADALGFRPGGNIELLIRELGGRIRIEEDFSSLSDKESIFVHGPGDFDIVLSLITSSLRDRFTIAHELGHYFLHSRQGEVPLVANRSGSNRAEWEANWFAGGFLMPSEPFIKSFNARKSPFELASEFCVSLPAVQTRMKVLGLNL